MRLDGFFTSFLAHRYRASAGEWAARSLRQSRTLGEVFRAGDNDFADFAETAYEIDVLHNRQRPEAADRFVNFTACKKRLVAVNKTENGGPDVRPRRNHAVFQQRRIYRKPETSARNAGPFHRFDYSFPPAARENRIRVAKQKKFAFCRRRPVMKLRAPAFFPLHQLHIERFGGGGGLLVARRDGHDYLGILFTGNLFEKIYEMLFLPEGRNDDR